MSKSEEMDEILDEHSKKMKELYSKYPYIDGVLDGGPPKKEHDKITKETISKLQKVKEKYNKNNS